MSENTKGAIKYGQWTCNIYSTQDGRTTKQKHNMCRTPLYIKLPGVIPWLRIIYGMNIGSLTNTELIIYGGKKSVLKMYWAFFVPQKYRLYKLEVPPMGFPKKV